MGKLILFAVLGALLVLAISLSAILWLQLGDVDISTNGVIAIVLCCLFAVTLGTGLMFLVFYSSRHGFDSEQDPRDEP